MNQADDMPESVALKQLALSGCIASALPFAGPMRWADGIRGDERALELRRSFY